MPPTEPTKTCLACDGRGEFLTIQAGMVIASDPCRECEGTGSVWHNHVYDPDDNPYAPDTWKEALGIA
jgi:DnaJ-class molecular chaperone